LQAANGCGNLGFAGSRTMNCELDRLFDTAAPSSSSANDRALAFDAVGRLNPHRFDAAGIDGEAVVVRCQIKVAMDRAEIGEIRSAPGQGIEASASRRLARYPAEHSNECSHNRDSSGVRHFLILEFNFRTVILANGGP